MLNMYKLTKNILLKWVFISKLNIYISVRPEKTLSKKIDREILQGDSMSPSLFVLCMDLLSRKLNEKYTKTSLVIDDGRYDEIYAQYRGKLYKEKSATNNPCCEGTAIFLKEYVFINTLE
ncbi:hypothetical protein CWI39_2865p0010 [Hamiltosporidium magnivora]|uniref:Reverse transcriptase domain-containing protein n=1 Tax=Hamiltosporidium magnivora TaxID=148818 RepID=A0A4Q9KS67_9MICR|nr:hypothetical protein CWI39_2865p0010 [Hamiltosporidium magnivora]